LLNQASLSQQTAGVAENAGTTPSQQNSGAVSAISPVPAPEPHHAGNQGGETAGNTGGQNTGGNTSAPEFGNTATAANGTGSTPEASNTATMPSGTGSGSLETYT